VLQVVSKQLECESGPQPYVLPFLRWLLPLFRLGFPYRLLLPLPPSAEISLDLGSREGAPHKVSPPSSPLPSFSLERSRALLTGCLSARPERSRVCKFPPPLPPLAPPRSLHASISSWVPPPHPSPGLSKCLRYVYDPACDFYVKTTQAVPPPSQNFFSLFPFPPGPSPSEISFCDFSLGALPKTLHAFFWRGSILPFSYYVPAFFVTRPIPPRSFFFSRCARGCLADRDSVNLISSLLFC